MKRIVLPVAVSVLALALAATQLIGADDLLLRVRQLKTETQYDLALSLLDETPPAKADLSDEYAWLQAQLTPDPDRFDRLVERLVEDHDVLEAAVQERSLARAREAFARGRYRGTLEGLAALPANARGDDSEIPLFESMASIAVGDAATARDGLQSIDASSPHYASAQALLAHLSVKTQRPKDAMEHARRALKSGNDDVDAQALYSLIQGARSLGLESDASRARAELLERFPRSVEAGHERVGTVSPASPSASVDSTRVVEEEAAGTRNEFALQFGAFHDRALALKLVEKLSRNPAANIATLRIETDRSASPTWYRVIGGRYQTRRTVEESRDRLREAGIDTMVLQPGRGGR